MQEYYLCESLTWEEWVTIRRIRLGWTKACLAKNVGIGRTRLWQALELKPGDPRHYVLNDRQRQMIEAGLDEAESDARVAVAS